MKRKIPCFCDNSFEAELPDEINLDDNPAYLDEILDGTFMNFICQFCGKKHKPEFKLSILWPSQKRRFEIFPELDRGEFYRRKKAPAAGGPGQIETIIGFPEMAERLAVIRDGYEPVVIEAIKYYLHLKAEEQYPDDESDIWYIPITAPGSAGKAEFLEFHIHGLKENEVAVMKIPCSLYQKTLDDFKKRPKGELFSSLNVRGYLSVRNLMRPEELK